MSCGYKKSLNQRGNTFDIGDKVFKNEPNLQKTAFKIFEVI